MHIKLEIISEVSKYCIDTNPLASRMLKHLFKEFESVYSTVEG